MPDQRLSITAREGFALAMGAARMRHLLQGALVAGAQEAMNEDTHRQVSAEQHRFADVLGRLFSRPWMFAVE
ncbi:MAG: hypothetical protein M0T84_18930 [Betaproteobacteria bacterium]|nr:hypothetical protein [Betaproteobacteria bacterium]